MPKRNRQSTKDVKAGTFKPHGSMEIQISDRLNILEAEGPFNAELVRAAGDAQEKLDHLLNQPGAWGTVLIFKTSALASLDAIEEIGNIVRNRAHQGIRPAAVALVFHPGVEGASLMKTHYQGAYASAGISVRSFEETEAAKSWVLKEIDDADRIQRNTTA